MATSTVGQRARTNIARRRLAGQHLIKSTLTNAADVVRALGAVQAQDYASAKWALAMRCATATNSMVEQAITDGRIVRTHVLRPTWHFVDPADIRWLLALTAPRVIARMAPYDRQLELDAETYRRSNAAITRALRDGRHSTREEIGHVLKEERIRTDSIRIAHLLMRAELDGIVCSGARRGKQFTYSLLEERIPSAPSMDRDEALLELTRRYFSTRGPATPQDFAWWSGLTVGDAKRGIDIAGTELRRDEIDGTAYWVTKSVVPPGGVRTAHLLPNYDEYFIGYRDRGAILQLVRGVKPKATLNGLTAHVIAVDGQIVGGWKRALKRNGVAVELNPVITLTGAQRKAISIAAERYGAFLELPVNIVWRAGKASGAAGGQRGFRSGVLR